MGRAERRRQQREKEKTYTRIMTKQDIDKLKQDMTEVVADELLAKILGISVLVMQSHFSDLIRLDVDGKTEPNGLRNGGGRHTKRLRRDV